MVEPIQQTVVPTTGGYTYVVTYATGKSPRYVTQVFDYSRSTKVFTPLTTPHPRQYLPAAQHVHNRLLRIWRDPFDVTCTTERTETGRPQ
jgi:hypothetical protein